MLAHVISTAGSRMLPPKDSRLVEPVLRHCDRVERAARSCPPTRLLHRGSSRPGDAGNAAKCDRFRKNPPMSLVRSWLGIPLAVPEALQMARGSGVGMVAAAM